MANRDTYLTADPVTQPRSLSFEQLMADVLDHRAKLIHWMNEAQKDRIGRTTMGQMLLMRCESLVDRINNLEHNLSGYVVIDVRRPEDADRNGGGFSD